MSPGPILNSLALADVSSVQNANKLTNKKTKIRAAKLTSLLIDYNQLGYHC